MNDLWVLKTCCLFAGFTEEKIGEFLKEAGTSVRSYRCLEEIYPFNDVIRESGIILSNVHLCTRYPQFSRNIILSLAESNLTLPMPKGRGFLLQRPLRCRKGFRFT